jgi:hypothetical protein
MSAVHRDANISVEGEDLNDLPSVKVNWLGLCFVIGKTLVQISARIQATPKILFRGFHSFQGNCIVTPPSLRVLLCLLYQALIIVPYNTA